LTGSIIGPLIVGELTRSIIGHLRLLNKSWVNDNSGNRLIGSNNSGLLSNIMCDNYIRSVLFVLISATADSDDNDDDNKEDKSADPIARRRG